MPESHTIYEWREIIANASAVFDLIGTEKFFALTGADEIKLDFQEGGSFLLDFKDRGKISGIVREIIPYHRVSLSWNVSGFNRPDEVSTLVRILIDTSNGTIVSVEHSGIENDEAAEAKRKAWGQILDDIKKLLEH
jgi:uncharacterized protein YndB with AHSA1/START domain